MTGSRAWELCDLQRPWPTSLDVHHLCMILAKRASSMPIPWAHTVVAFLSEPPLDIVAICHGPWRRSLGSFVKGYSMQLWDAREGSLLRETRLLDAQEEVHAVEVSGSGNAIAIGHGSGHLQVHHHGRGRLETFSKRLGTYALRQLAFQRDGRMLAAIAGEFAARHVYIIDTFTQFCCRDMRIAPVSPDCGLLPMTWAPGGRVLAIGASRDLATFYDAEGVYRDCRLLEYRNIMRGYWMTELGFSNEGDVLALIGVDVMKLFEVEYSPTDNRMSFLQQINLEDKQACDAIEWLPHGHAFVVLITEYATVEQQPVTAGCCLQIFYRRLCSHYVHARTVYMQPELQVHCFAIDHTHTDATYDGTRSWNGLRIVTVTDDGMHVWDMDTGSLLRQWNTTSQSDTCFPNQLASTGSQVLAVLG